MVVLGSGLVAFFVAFAVIRVLLTRFGRFGMDTPNARSLHDRPIPRTGGLAVLAGTAVAVALGPATLWVPAILALLLAALSFIDDLRGVPLALRLAAHLAAAGLLVWYLTTPMYLVEAVLIVVAVAWLTDLYNFMDGADGLAGGMATIGFTAYAIAAYMSDELALASFATALASSAAAFLAHNYHPARIFLGDVGSVPLGFLAGALGLAGWRLEAWPLWFPVLVFGPFISDATITLIKRLVRGERVWQAHRSHYYQRMVLMGLGHRRTAHLLYALMVACALAALIGRNQAPHLQAIAFLSASAALAAVAIWVDVRWARFMQSEGDAA